MKLTINSMSVYEFGNRNKYPVVFVHGFPFDHTLWMNQINLLEKDFYTVAYDIRGFGESYVGDGQYTMEAYVNDLFSIMSELDLKKPVLCGFSMGGYISLRAVEKDQSKFGGLILVDTRSEADNDEGKLKRAAAINQINVDGLQSFVQSFVPNLFADETKKSNKKLFDETLTRCFTHNPTGIKGGLFAMISRTDTTKFLGKIKIPTLVLAGSQDTLTPPGMMREMAGKIKDSEFGIVSRAGHMSPIENPSYVNDMISGFLKRKILKQSD